MKKINGQRSGYLSGMRVLMLASVLLPMACLGATEIINSNAPSPLAIAVKDSGTPGVWVNQPDNTNQYQYFNTYSWGSIIWLNGTNTSGRYTTGYTGSPTTNSPVSNTKTGSGTTNDPYVITTVVKLGTNDIYMNQRFAYVNGDRYFQKNWTLTNSGATTYTDLRFFHGGDAYFGGVDAARSWWDDANQKIYLNNNNFTNCGYMSFYPNPATPVAGYYGGLYTYGNNQAAILAQLSNTASSVYQDAGYYLQWNKTSLAPGQTWTIEAYEYWSLPGSLGIMPPANEYVETNSTVGLVFKVHNLSTNAESSIGLSVAGGDWSVSLPDGTNIALAGLAISNVNVNVVVPAGVADGATKDIALTALSGVSTGTGSSRLTAYIPTFTITPNPLNFGTVAPGATNDLNVTLSNNASGSSLTIGTISDTLDAPFSIVADNASGQTVAPGGSCSVTVRFAPTSEVLSADSFSWPIVSPIVLSRTIEVQGTGAVQEDGWLAINVTPETGSWALTAPVGYTGPTSGTGNLAAVSAVTGQYGISYGTLSGYVAPSNQTGFVTGGSTTLFTVVYLQISTNIGTPTGVSATEGSYTNKIRVTWQGVTGATGYEIWRSQTNDPATAGRIADIPLISLRQIAEDLKGRAQQPVAPFLRKADGQAVRPYLAGNTYYYDDYAVNPIYAYYYWVRAKTATLISPLSYVGAGYAALDPSRATGSADIGVSDFVFLPVNITNLSHPGTMSCWIQNHGADNLANSAVRMDVYMTNNATPAAWIGYAQTNLTLNAGEEKVIILSATDKQGMSIRADLNGTGQPEIHIRHLTTINDPNLANNTAYGAGVVTVKSGGVNSLARTINDYDGDGKSDLAICATNMSSWEVLLSETRYRDAVVVESGNTGWIAVPGDYEGAGITGVGVYVPVDEFWYVWFPSGGHGAWCSLGGMEYEPAQADYDGDNKTDPAVYLAAEGYWRGYESGHGYAAGETWIGGLGYEPVVRDYDGDGKADPMTYAERTGIWIGQLTGTQYGLVSDHFGGYGYQAVPADYDGDGKADPAVYEMATGTWYAWLSKYGYPAVIAQPFGGMDFLPIVGDYDGDGKADPAIYCKTSGVWYGALSSRNYLMVYAIFGGIDYYPISE